MTDHTSPGLDAESDHPADLFGEALALMRDEYPHTDIVVIVRGGNGMGLDAGGLDDFTLRALLRELNENLCDAGKVKRIEDAG